MGSHCLWVFTGESNHSTVSERWYEMDFVHPQYVFEGNLEENASFGVEGYLLFCC